MSALNISRISNVRLKHSKQKEDNFLQKYNQTISLSLSLYLVGSKTQIRDWLRFRKCKNRTANILFLICNISENFLIVFILRLRSNIKWNWERRKRKQRINVCFFAIIFLNTCICLNCFTTPKTTVVESFICEDSFLRDCLLSLINNVFLNCSNSVIILKTIVVDNPICKNSFRRDCYLFNNVYLNHLNFFAVMKTIVVDIPIYETSFRRDFQVNGLNEFNAWTYNGDLQLITYTAVLNLSDSVNLLTLLINRPNSKLLIWEI